MSTKRRTPCMSPFSALSSNKFSTMMSSRRQTTKTEQRRGCKSVSRTKTLERTSEQVASCPCFLFTTLPSTVGITSTVCVNSALKRKTSGFLRRRVAIGWPRGKCVTSQPISESNVNKSRRYTIQHVNHGYVRLRGSTIFV